MSRGCIYIGIAAILGAATACSPVPPGGGNGGSGGSENNGGSSGSTNQGGTGSNNGGSGVGGFGGSGPGVGGSANTCATDPAVDDDGDGFSENDDDCNDCDANVNPGAIEVVAQPDENGMTPEAADEDCDGTVDNVAPFCDDNLQIGDTDPIHGANAIDLCQTATAGDKKWGILGAKYVRADGSSGSPPNSLQYGIMNKFGSAVNTQAGARMLALSAGNARDLDDPNPCDTQSCHSGTQGNAPPGFPQQVCNAAPTIFDDVGLDLKIRTPKNATGYSFNFKFYSFEFAEWVCTSYNDQFIALASPAPPGALNGNISFDSKGNPVSVNIGFFDVCDPATLDSFALFCSSGCPSPPNPYCPSGPGQLAQTGFDTWGDAGATSWLKTQAPVQGGQELNLRFTIWDAGDQNLDSSILIDNFQWIANGGTVTIGTEEIPEPK